MLAALGMAMVLSLPLIGMALATPKADVAAHALTREPLVITVLPPLAMRTDFYGGSVIPVKILLTDPDDGTGIAGANVTVWVNGDPASSHGAVNMVNVMKDMGGGLYMYNLNTKPYPAGPGSAPIDVKIVAIGMEDRGGEVDLLLSLD